MNIQRHIPVALPRNRKDWSSLTVEDLTEDPKFTEFINSWENALASASRQSVYLEALTVDLDVERSEKISPELVKVLLEKAMDRAAPSTGEVQNMVEGFEVLSVACGFADHVVNSLPKAASESITPMMENAYALQLGCACAAINAHFEE